MKETADQDAFNSALWRVNELQFQAIRLLTPKRTVGRRTAGSQGAI